MSRSTCAVLLAILSLVFVATQLAPHPTVTAAATLAPPQFKAKAVLRVIASPAGRQRFGLGAHAYLSSLRYGVAAEVFPGELHRGSSQSAIWALTFLDPRASSDQGTQGQTMICPTTLIALSAVDGSLLGRACRTSLPAALATLAPPGFGVAGILQDLRCRCAADGPGPFHFGVGHHAYLAVMRYGRIRDLFPGNPLGKAIQGQRIWDLVFLDPQIALDKRLAGRHAGSICARNTVSLRATDGTDWAWACYPGG